MSPSRKRPSRQGSKPPSLRFRAFMPMVMVAAMVGLVAGGSGAALIALIGRTLSAGEKPEQLPWIFAALCALVVVARTLAALMISHLGQRIIYALRLQLSRLILAAALPRLQALGSARLLAGLTEDIAMLAAAVEALPWLCSNAALVLGSLGYIGYLALPLLGMVLGAMALGMLSFQVCRHKAFGAFSKAREHEDDLYAHFRGLTDGIKELKLNQARREAFLSDALAATAADCRRHNVVGKKIYILAANWGNGLFLATIGLILFVPPLWPEVSAPALTGCVLAFLYMMTPLNTFMETLPLLGQAKVALGKLQALAQALVVPAETIDPAMAEPAASPGVLELVGVTHRYREEQGEASFTLGPLDLRLPPGEMVFLVGGNGSGKSTLALLLVGLYAPEQGEIRLDGRPVGEGGRNHYRQHFAAVFSDFYLFESLLGFNGQELDAEARAYLAQLRLDHKVRIENGTFSTLDLSQGQRKRLALLVAYLEDRPFYVFDEWAADQDPLFKKIFYTEILPSLKAKGKTVIVITHDDRYFDVADRCLLLEEGRITEMPIGRRQREQREPGNPTGVEWGTTDEGVLL